MLFLFETNFSFGSFNRLLFLSSPIIIYYVHSFYIYVAYTFEIMIGRHTHSSPSVVCIL